MPDHAPTDRPLKVRILAFVLFLIASFAAGGVGSALQGSTEEVQQTYLAFTLPSWAPPTSAFGIVWPVLYVLIGIAAWRFWDVADAWRWPLGVWAGQLILNAIWPAVFFGVDLLGAAVGIIALLIAVVAYNVRLFGKVDKLAATLLLPYLAWLIYAGALNTAVWWRN